jgi:hypothetical protein
MGVSMSGTARLQNAVADRRLLEHTIQKQGFGGDPLKVWDQVAKQTEKLLQTVTFV